MVGTVSERKKTEDGETKIGKLTGGENEMNPKTPLFSSSPEKIRVLASALPTSASPILMHAVEFQAGVGANHYLVQRDLFGGGLLKKGCQDR